MNYKTIAVIVFGVIIVVLIVLSLSPAPAPSHTVITASKVYPSNLHLVGKLCVGSYDNGVSVSWPAINGTC